MSLEEMLPLLVQATVGVVLAACCGLRAFLPPFVFGLAVRLGVDEALLGRPLELHASFEWLSSTPALVIFGVAVIAELLADKIPAVDHALDSVQTFVRPVAGMLVVAASLEGLDPLPATVIGLIVGGSVAGGVHVAKANVRAVSTVTTGGLASPILSVVEDVVVAAGAVIAVTAAVAAAAMLLLAALALFVLVRRMRRRPAVAG